MRRLTCAVSALAVAACTPATRSPANGVTADVHATAADTMRDPLLRVGTLSNGLRYYVRHNTAPAHRASLWLAVNAGSLLEDDDQQGLAHFLEHMAFNGTRHFPRNDLVRFVESTGMEFGPDLNAYTNFDETVYQLTLPTDEPDNVDRGLDVIQDWASGGMLLDSSEVVAERGVVIGEWRMRDLRDSVSERLQQHLRDVLFGTSRYRSRSPIGKTSILRTASVEPLRRFYRDWYRPDRMAVIAVGAFDADSMEQQIRERFGGIPAATSRRPVPDAALSLSDTVIDIVRDKVSPRLSILWPATPTPSSPAARVEHQIIDDLLLDYLSERLVRIREQESKPLVYASIGRSQIVRPMPLVALEVVAWPDSLSRALRTVLTEMERVAQHGVPEARLDLQKAALLRRLEARATSEIARPSADYANAYRGHFLENDGHLLSAAQELALARDILPSVTPMRIAEAARFWRRLQGIKVIVQMPAYAPGAVAPTRKSILALWDSIARTRLPAEPVTIAAQAALMKEVPAPGHVVRETVRAASGIVEWTLSNGARVLYKASGNNPDELLIKAWSPGGFSVVPDSLFFTSGRMVALMMTEAAGLGERTHDELMSQLAPKGVRRLRVNIGYADEDIELAGSPRETELLFQLLHLQFVAPKLDTTALKVWKNFAKYEWRGASQAEVLAQMFTNGNPRLAPIQTQMADLARLDEAMAVYRDRFGNAGDFTFLIVGAAPVEDVRSLVERYVASLPASEQRETARSASVRPPGVPAVSEHKSLPFPRADSWLMFYGDLPSDPELYLRERQRLSALTILAQRRLRDRLREEMGGTYGVGVQNFTQHISGEHFRLLVSFQSSPEQARHMNREMVRVLDSIRVHGATAEEARIVSRVQQRRLETALQRNRFWLDQMQLYTRLGIPLDRIVSPYPDSTLTTDDLKAAATRYLPRGASIHMVTLPRDSAQKVDGPSNAPDTPGPQWQRQSSAQVPCHHPRRSKCFEHPC